jgi:branched-chain amino acid transport system permease protein
LRPLHLLISVGLVVVIWLLGYSIDNYMNPYYARVVVNCGIGIILALSLNLINGCAGQFSLGHAGFMGVGAYTSAFFSSVLMIPFFQTELGVGLAILMGGLMAAFAGYLVGLPSLRLRGDYLAIVTLGFGEIIRIIFLNVRTLGGALGIRGIPPVTNFFWVYLWVLITFVVLYRLLYSSYGRAILSVRENEIAAEAMGINIARYKIVAFVISSFFAGVAGGLYAHFNSLIEPNSFNFNRSVEAVIMVVIGGMGSISGAVIGGIIVTLLPELLRAVNEYRMVIFPLVLILLMLLRPMGLMGHREIWHFFNRKHRA